MDKLDNFMAGSTNTAITPVDPKKKKEKDKLKGLTPPKKPVLTGSDTLG